MTECFWMISREFFLEDTISMKYYTDNYNDVLRNIVNFGKI